jgi:transposase
MAYSMDLRRRAVDALKRGESAAAVARRLEVSAKSVLRWRRRDASGRLPRERTGPKRPIKLTEADDRLMIAEVTRRPGVTANELRPLLSVDVAECTVCRRLKKLGLRVKKRKSARRSS